jgi:hypothetical protein
MLLPSGAIVTVTLNFAGPGFVYRVSIPLLL